MAKKLNLANVGWRAAFKNVEELPDFPARPNGVPTTVSTLDALAAGYNALCDETTALRQEVAALPFPFGAGS